MRVIEDDLTGPQIVGLLEFHFAQLRSLSPIESCHVLPVDELRAPDATVWSAWDGTRLLGCGALKELASDHGEIKSMRTTEAARGTGVGTAILKRIVDEAAGRGYVRVSLETGVQDEFAAARRLYERHGFTVCAPFAGYVDDPNSVFMTRTIAPRDGAA